MQEEAAKYDKGKAQLSLIPKYGLELIAEALTIGKDKYGRYNFKKGMPASRLIDACLRHTYAWMEGEDHDPEDGQHHLGAAGACLVMLMDTIKLGTVEDDRYIAPKAEEQVEKDDSCLEFYGKKLEPGFDYEVEFHTYEDLKKHPDFICRSATASVRSFLNMRHQLVRHFDYKTVIRGEDQYSCRVEGCASTLYSPNIGLYLKSARKIDKAKTYSTDEITRITTEYLDMINAINEGELT